jgi:phage repressor protein C with HTH and peptisase S24 domain
MKAIDRLYLYLDNQKIKPTNFETLVGLSSGYLSIQRKRNGDLGETQLNKIIDYCRFLSAEWLLTGKGDMIKKKYNDNEYAKIEAFVSEGSGKCSHSKKEIPLVNVQAMAGFGSADFAIKEEDIQGLYVIPDFNGIDFMIRVKGSSMYPKYSSGDIVACRKINDSKFIQWNKCYVVGTKEQGILVKRLKQGDNKECLTAVSDNKEYPPFEIPINEITGIALVVGVIRLE